jgi:hypothetical protein
LAGIPACLCGKTVIQINVAKGTGPEVTQNMKKIIKNAR